MTSELKTKVKVALVVRNKNQRWLAEQIGINPSQLSDIINGKRKGKKTDLYVKEISQVLGIEQKEGKQMNDLQHVSYNNDLILTTEQLANFYGTTPQHIKQNFANNRSKFIEGKHFYQLVGQTLKEFKDRVENFDLVGKNANTLTLWTKRGASRHSKMLGTDQAWNMYDELEENYFNPNKQQLDLSNLSPELQMVQGLINSQAKQELATKKLESKVDGISDIVSLNVTDWRKQTNSLIRAMANTQGGYGAYKEISGNIYAETDRRAGSDLNRRLQNLRSRMALEGASKSKIAKTNRLDVLEDDKRLKEIYLAVVKDFAIKYQVWNKEYQEEQAWIKDQ